MHQIRAARRRTCPAPASVTIDSACKCGQCDAEFGLDDVRSMMSKWATVMAWVNAELFRMLSRRWIARTLTFIWAAS